MWVILVSRGLWLLGLVNVECLDGWVGVVPSVGGVYVCVVSRWGVGGMYVFFWEGGGVIELAAKKRCRGGIFMY